MSGHATAGMNTTIPALAVRDAAVAVAHDRDRGRVRAARPRLGAAPDGEHRPGRGGYPCPAPSRASPSTLRDRTRSTTMIPMFSTTRAASARDHRAATPSAHPRQAVRGQTAPYCEDHHRPGEALAELE